MEHLTIGQAMRKARKAKKYTLEKLEKKAGISRQSIGRWERDKVSPNILNVISIADVLGVTLDELVGRTVER